MEPISKSLQQTQGKETQIGSKSSEQSLIRSSQQARKNPAYLANCIELVNKTIRLANQPPLATDDAIERAKDWMDALEPIVPLDRLPAVYARAVADHETTFPVNFFDLKVAWDKISAEEKKKQTEDLQKTIRENAVAFCVRRDFHANADGEVEYDDPFDTTKQVLMPCVTCRPQAFEAARARRAAAHPNAAVAPLELVEKYVEVEKPALRAVTPQTPAEEAAAARSHIRKLMENPRLTKEQYDDYQRAYDHWGERLLELIGSDAVVVEESEEPKI